MFSLWILGSMLEPAIGQLRFALIFFVSLLAGSFGALIVTRTRSRWAPPAASSG